MAQIKTLLESLNQIEAEMFTPYTGKETVTETELTENDVRKMTNKLIDAMGDGMIHERDVAYAALSYMSEEDVADLIRSNDWLWLEDDEVDESVENKLAEDELGTDPWGIGEENY